MTSTASDVQIRELIQIDDAQLEQLAEILVGVVEQGASVGYLPPLAFDDAREYWRGVCRPGNLLLVAEIGGRIAGTAQLELAGKANGRHRAEVNKVLVHPAFQRRGIARRLMFGLENLARREGRTLLHLDTREGDPSNPLYQGCGYAQAGVIPAWAAGADGHLYGTVFYYKLLN